MNRPVTLLLLLMLLVSPQAVSQEGIGPDVRVDGVALAIDPIVNATGEVRVSISSNAPARVTITYAWGDGAPLSGDESTANADSSVVTVLREAGSYEYTFSFRPGIARRGPQEIVVSVQTESDANRTNDVLRRGVFVRDPHLNLTFDTPVRTEVIAEEWVPVRYRVANLGNAVERPVVTVTVNAPWQAAQYGSLPEVLPGGSITGIVFVRGDPSNTTALMLRVTVRSSVHIAMTVTGTAPSMVANATTLPARIVEMVGMPQTVQILVDETVFLPFTIHNRGIVDDIINVTVSPVPGWTMRIEPGADWQSNASRPDADHTAVVLPPGGSASLSLNVTRGDNATTQQITVTAVSRNAALYAARVESRHTANMSARLVVAGPDLAVDITRLPSVIYQGDVPSVDLVVRNAGREASRNATLTVDLRDNVRTAAEAVFVIPPLLPGAIHRTVWNFSTIGLAAEFSLGARIMPNTTGPQDRDLVNDEATARVHVRVPRLRALGPEAIVGIPGEEIVIRSSAGGFSIENQGDRDETLEVRLSGPAWAETSWRVDVASRSARVIAVALDIPDRLERQSFDLTLTAFVANRTQFTTSIGTTLRIDDVDTPTIVPGHLEAGVVRTPVMLIATMIDAFGIDHARALVTAPDGTRVSVALEPQGDHRYSGTFVPRIAGVHLIEYRATDASDRAQAASVGNQTIEVRPEAYAGVNLVDFGDGDAIGTRVLHLREVVEGTTRSLIADDGSGPTSIDPPYDLELTWKEGPHRLIVRAESHDGAIFERAWNLTLDLTPPSLSSPTVERRADGKLQLRIDAPQAKNVTARFDTSNAPVSVELDARSAGVFASVVAPPQSWTRVSFIATDAAGNTASTMVEARTDATPIGVFLAGLAIMIAASLRRVTRGRG